LCVVDDRPCRVHKVATLTVNEDETLVVGVTVLGDRIYVVSRMSDVITVFTSQQPFRRLQDIVVNGLLYPVDIAASVNIGCLYLSDTDSVVVWRISVNDGAVVQWLTGLRARSVSVTSDDKVVLLVAVDIQGSVNERNSTWRGQVHVYSPDTVIETLITLSPDITSPWSVIMRTRKTFIVSYGVPWHEVNGVCEVDTTGRVLKAFGSSPGRDVGQLNMPRRVSLDDKERVIVADTNNRRVMLLNKQLTSSRILLTWHQQSLGDEADAPCTQYYDHHTGTLLVGLWSGHVDVYKIIN